MSIDRKTDSILPRKHSSGRYTQSLTGTKRRGTLEDEYAIYVDCVKGSGQKVKTFDEWLNGSCS